MKKINLDFSFKGNRTYVHGTDIYRQIMSNIDSNEFNNWNYFEINIKKISNCNMICFLSEKKQKLEGEIVNFTLKKDSKKLYGSVLENLESEVKSRYEFNDENISKYCVMNNEDDSMVYFNPENEFKTIDIIIEMCKLLLENSSDNSDKWFFRTLKVFRAIEETEVKQFYIKKTSQRMNIAVIDIYSGDELISRGYAASIPR